MNTDNLHYILVNSLTPLQRDIVELLDLEYTVAPSTVLDWYTEKILSLYLFVNTGIKYPDGVSLYRLYTKETLKENGVL